MRSEMNSYLHLFVTGIVIMVIFMYQRHRLNEMNTMIETQARQIDELKRANEADNNLFNILQDRLAVMDDKVLRSADKKVDIPNDVLLKLSHEIDSKVRGYLLDEKGKVNWLKLVSSVDIKPTTEVTHHISLRLDNIETHVAQLIKTGQYLAEHSLLLETANVCVFTPTDECPRGMKPLNRFALGTFHAEGKLPQGYLDSGPFNDNGWKWMQGGLCCLHT